MANLASSVFLPIPDPQIILKHILYVISSHLKIVQYVFLQGLFLKNIITISLSYLKINSWALSKIYALSQSFFLLRKVWLKIWPIHCNWLTHLKLILIYRFPYHDFFLGNSFVKEMGLLFLYTCPSVASDCIPSYANNTELLQGGHRPADSRRDKGLVPTFK